LPITAYSHSSTNSENFVKLGHDPVDIELFVLTGIVKNKFKKNETEAEHIARRVCFLQPGERN